MATSEKLITIANNTEKVFNAGYNKCLKENPPGAGEEELQQKYDEGYNFGYSNGYTVGYSEGSESSRDLWYNNGIIDGKKAEYDAFWDMFQVNGTRTNYSYAFSGIGFDVELIKPKYPIVPTRATYMFAQNTRGYPGRRDYSEICKILDLSQITDATSIFQNICGKNLTVDLSNCERATNAFNCNSGGNIDNLTLKVTEKLTSASQFFYYNSDLTTLTFTDDSVIAFAIYLARSPLLTKASIESVINALSTTTSGLTVTLSKVAVNNAFGINVDDASTYPEGSEYYNLRNSKSNWTISYA